MAEIPTTGNDVSWAMQFEEEWFTRLECAKLSVAGRLPKIHFVSLLGAEIAEPIVIGHSDEEAHGASTKATVGGEIFDLLVHSFAKHFGSRPAPRAVTISSGSSRITHPTPIRRLPLPYWQEAGWSKKANVYQGNYQTRYGAYQGWIEERSPHQISFFILEPPREVLRSSHGACFQPRNDRWFNVHMSTPPKDVSSGIVAVERLVSECFRNAR
jgi:hypothetical protein